MNRSSKPVPAAEFRADQIAVVAKSFAQLEDLKLQIIRPDKDSWPTATHELIFGDERSVGLQQS